MTQLSNRIVLAARPKGEPVASDFRLEQVPAPEPSDGQLLCETIYLSLDPYMRGRMSDAASYAQPVGVGEVMVGGAVGRVLASRAEGFAEGDFVLAQGGWQSHFVTVAREARKLDPTLAPISTALGVLGMPGFTAYVGLLDIGKPVAGETVVVAAASGAVGQVVGQIARIKGCRVVGIAGAPEKCRYITDELGFDAAVSHRNVAMAGQLRAACPNGIDVYFENVGGRVFDAVLPRLNVGARIPLCGVIANYNATALPPGPNQVPRLMGALLTKRVLVQGFIITDPQHRPRAAEFAREVSAWVRDGALRYKEDIEVGLERAPQAFIGLLRGDNVGKLLVRVAPDPTR